jgi:hypothetical protein
MIASLVVIFILVRLLSLIRKKTPGSTKSYGTGEVNPTQSI